MSWLVIVGIVVAVALALYFWEYVLLLIAGLCVLAGSIHLGREITLGAKAREQAAYDKAYADGLKDGKEEGLLRGELKGWEAGYAAGLEEAPKCTPRKVVTFK